MYSSSNKLSFVTVLSPSDDNYDSRRVEEILLEIPTFRESKGKKWIVNVDKKESFIYDDIPSMSDDEIRDSVNKFFDKITPIVEKVESKFLEKKDELMRLRN